MTPIASDSPPEREPPAGKREGAAPGERLRIAHLLLWMAGTAFALGFFRTFFDTGRGPQIDLSQRMIALIVAPLSGAALASLPLAAWQIIRGKRAFPQQPGHWLLVVQGVSFLAGAIATLATEPAEPAGGYSEITILISTREFWRLLPTLFVTILALMRARESRWRWMFGLMAAGYGACVLFGFRALGGTVDAFQLGTSLLWFFQTLSVCVLVACMIYDRNEPVRRDFLHMVGVITRLAGVVIWWLVPLVIQFARD